MATTDAYIKNIGARNPRRIFGFGVLAGGFIGLGLGYHIYKYYHSCVFTVTFDSIKAKQQGSIEGQMDHILKPSLNLNDQIYVKKFRFKSSAFAANQWNQYQDNRRKFYEEKGFKKEDVEKYQIYSYHLMDFNTKFLTRLLFKETGVSVRETYYRDISSLEEEYEKILKKLIDQKILHSGHIP